MDEELLPSGETIFSPPLSSIRQLPLSDEFATKLQIGQRNIPPSSGIPLQI
jgi:hypothetical protein